MSTFLRTLFAAWLLACGTGCALHTPTPCCKAVTDTRPEMRRLKQRFVEHSVIVNQRPLQVFTPNGQAWHPHGAPVLLLPEMPSLSPNMMELGLRLAEKGYAVYIPVLWGDANGSAHPSGQFIRYSFELAADPRWLTGLSNYDRPVTHDLATFCRQEIIPHHRGQKIGVIGNCLTGTFAFSLAAQVPQVSAPVASQPAIPLGAGGFRKAQIGLSTRELRALHERAAAEPTFQLLGFRFEGDQVSPAARFTTLNRSGLPFLDGTIPACAYQKRDGLPLRAHTVLTGCYLDGRYRSTRHAWNELCGFLAAKLGPAGPRIYRLDRDF